MNRYDTFNIPYFLTAALVGGTVSSLSHIALFQPLNVLRVRITPFSHLGISPLLSLIIIMHIF